MRIAIGAIGLLKSGPEKELVAGYAERIKATGRKAGITGLTMQDWSESQAATAGARKAEESERLLGMAGDGLVVMLDERGKTMSSEEFAAWLGKQAGEGVKQLTFLLGGPDGHNPENRKKAGLVLSFGPMTFPHRLARIMLLEQIYRAVTILVNHPYHRQ